jgi:hypothetical protein
MPCWHPTPHKPLATPSPGRFIPAANEVRYQSSDLLRNVILFNEIDPR